MIWSTNFAGFIQLNMFLSSKHALEKRFRNLGLSHKGSFFFLHSSCRVSQNEWPSRTFKTGILYISSIRLLPQSFTKYVRLTLVFTWNSTRTIQFLFFKISLLVLRKFSTCQVDWALWYHLIEFRHFPDISWFPKILSLKAFGNSWGNLYILSL